MRLTKIVVGVDGTPRGDHALRAAARLAAAADASLMALSVVDATTAARPRAPLGVSAGAARARHQVRLGAPSIEISRFAEQEQADLIVLGRCAATPAALRHTGTPTEGTLRRARVPVLIVPEGCETASRVVAALAADPQSVEVLDAACTVAALLHVPLEALHVEPEYALAGVPAPGRDALSAVLARHAAAAPALQVRRGDPARKILEEILAHPCDLLAIGRRRGSTALDREADSIAARVLAQAPCGVLVVPI